MREVEDRMARITLSNVEIFDGEKCLPGTSSVHVAGDRIVAVGAAPDGFAADETIDGRGMTLMPGMTSCHFHAEYSFINVRTYFDQPVGTERPPGVLMLGAAKAMKTALMSGFTGVVGAGSAEQIDAQLKMAISQGIIQGPRSIPCSRGLDSVAHGYNDTAPWWKDMRQMGSFRFCSGKEEFRRAVREEVRMGAEMIKIFPTTGRGGIEPHNIKGLTDDELQVTVEAAHQRNVKVRAHCCYRDDMLQCIGRGVDIIDHGDEIDETVIALMLAKGTYFVPSLYLLSLYKAHSEHNVGEAYDLHEQADEASYEEILKNVKKAAEAGVKIVTGDDYGLELAPHAPGEYSKELPFYVNDVGIAPELVLKWATKNGAELRGHDAGEIAPGKLADLIIVDGRPTEDIGLLTDVDNIRLIMLGGETVKNSLSEAGAARRNEGFRAVG
jgi:imidazolonepropionase-like amidohydrolase